MNTSRNRSHSSCFQAVEDQASEWLPICNRAAYEYYTSRKYQSDWTRKK